MPTGKPSASVRIFSKGPTSPAQATLNLATPDLKKDGGDLRLINRGEVAPNARKPLPSGWKKEKGV
jgi:hypothetical protein